MLVEIGSSLACARTVLKELHYQSSLLATLRERVSEGVELANRYYQTWHSIFWNGANAATKRRVTAVLDRIAWKVADLIYDALALFDRFCDEQERLGTPVTPQVFELRRLLAAAEAGLRRYHRHEIRAKQLELFEVGAYEVSNAPPVFNGVQRWLDYWTKPLPGERRSRWSVLRDRGVGLFNPGVNRQLALPISFPN